MTDEPIIRERTLEEKLNLIIVKVATFEVNLLKVAQRVDEHSEVIGIINNAQHEFATLLEQIIAELPDDGQPRLIV